MGDQLHTDEEKNNIPDRIHYIYTVLQTLMTHKTLFVLNQAYINDYLSPPRLQTGYDKVYKQYIHQWLKIKYKC